MMRCPGCGADNRDHAKFCKVCGARLLLPVVPKPPTLLGPVPPAGPPLPGGAGGGLVPAASPLPPVPFGAPVGFPRNWNAVSQPVIEGRVVHMDAPVQEKAPIGGRVLVAGALALIKPVLAFLPFAQGGTVTVRYLRVLDWQTGRERSVKMRGDPAGIISVGDWLAVWGKEEGGNIIMRAAYNYNTNAEIRLK